MIFKPYQFAFRSLLLVLRDNMRYSCAGVLVGVIGVNIYSSAGCCYVGVDYPKLNLGGWLASTKVGSSRRDRLLPISASWLPMMLGRLSPLSAIATGASSCFVSSWLVAEHKDFTCCGRRLTLNARGVKVSRLVEDRAFDTLTKLRYWLRLLFEQIQHLSFVFCT